VIQTPCYTCQTRVNTLQTHYTRKLHVVLHKATAPAAQHVGDNLQCERLEYILYYEE
jgi:hypothetical protein